MRLFTNATAVQNAKQAIRASSIHPGPIDTAMSQQVWHGDEQNRKEAIARTPLEDIAYGALFLASDESSFMTGSELVIDGANTAQ